MVWFLWKWNVCKKWNFQNMWIAREFQPTWERYLIYKIKYLTKITRLKRSLWTQVLKMLSTSRKKMPHFQRFKKKMPNLFHENNQGKKKTMGISRPLTVKCTSWTGCTCILYIWENITAPFDILRSVLYKRHGNMNVKINNSFINWQSDRCTLLYIINTYLIMIVPYSVQEDSA